MRKKPASIAGLKYSTTDIVINCIQDKKGEDIVHLDLTEIRDAVADHFIICDATSTTQVRAIGNHITEKMFEETGRQPYGKEGFDQAEWILIDYADVVVHIFYKEKRYFYQLGGPVVPIRIRKKS
ncbi:MAG: ribosome silencing factor [Chitinophagales bacterium]